MRISPRFAVVIVAIVIALGPAVAFAQPAGPALPWPSRVEPVGRPGALGVIREVDAVRLEPRFVGPFYVPVEQDRADVAALLGEEAEVEFEGPGSFVYRVSNEGERTARERRAEYFVYVSAEEGNPGVHVQRTWFGYFPAKGKPEGLVLLMPGMFGTPDPILIMLTDKLRLRGWAVLRMMSHPSRFTERSEFEVRADELAGSVGEIASVMTGRAAEAAFAAEAAVEHVVAKHEELAGVPRVLIGTSGGAMILPTVAAREPEQWAAAVVIAGGCNFFGCADESNYKQMIDAMAFRWLPARPSAEVRAEAYRLYLERAPLDSANTARVLEGKPVLMIHGTLDGAVPAKFGDELWERLGKPERWAEEAGHEEVFMRLPQKMGRIVEWIERATKRGADASGAPTAEGQGRQGIGGP